MSEARTMLDRHTAPKDFEEFVAARSAALVWRRWDSIVRREAAESYVRAAIATTYTDWWRRRWNGEVATGDLPDTAPAGAGEAAGVEVRRDVLAALDLLPRGQRAVVVLRYFDDLTEQQTADALGISVGTVKSQTSRALSALRTSPLFAEGDPS